MSSRRSAASIALSLQHADVGYAASSIALYLILLAGIGIVLGHVEAHAPRPTAARRRSSSEVAYQNRVYEVLLDVALMALAYYAAFRFRFQGRSSTISCRYFARRFPWCSPASLAGLALAGKYRQVWRSSVRPSCVGDPQGHRDRRCRRRPC